MEQETEGVTNDDISVDSDNNGAGTDSAVPDNEPDGRAAETDVVSDTGGTDDEQQDAGTDESGGQPGTDSGTEETAAESEETADGSGDGTGVDETESETAGTETTEQETEPGTESETGQETESETETESESGSDGSTGAAGENGDGGGLTTEQYEALVEQIDQLHADNEQLHYDFGIVASFLIFFAIEMAFRYLYRLFRIFI